MPTPKTTARKSKTVREGVAAKLSHIERALADIRQMVDMNCGEAVLRTARAAGAAAAEEVLTTLAPAAAQLFNTPPAPFEALPTLAVPPPKSSRRAKEATKIQQQEENTVSPLTQAIIDQDKIFEAEDAAARNALAPPKSSRRTKKASKTQQQEENTVSPLTQAIMEQDKIFAAEDAAAAKKPGPKLWNEFLRNYMSRQEASGRKITRLQAMAEAGPNYRTKYGISEKKNRITAKVAKTMGAVQVAPVERPANVNGYSLINRGAVPVVPTTPGRQSPPIPLNVPTTSPGILNTLRAALEGKSPPSNNSLKTSTSFSGSPVTYPQANAPMPANAPMSANAPMPANRPNTNYYDYENMGMEENGTRKVRIAGEDYLMTNQDRGIFRPVNGSLEWVGYLEPGGQIRATNSPE